MSAPLSFLLGYLLGSVPTAYLLVRWKSKIDIRQAGSGNVGTLNSYLVTNSKAVGAVVLVLDVLKGSVAVLCARAIWNDGVAEIAAAGVGATIGHTFPVWLGFKGGRGLATAAGVMFVVAWKIVAVWGIFWFLGHRLSRDVNVGSTVACLFTLGVILLLPGEVLAWLLSDNSDQLKYKYFAVVLFAILLAKLAQPVSEWLRRYQTKG
ncbi:MAG: glycerol-3-phosphate acyltransferase [Bacteroidota bacterium]